MPDDMKRYGIAAVAIAVLFPACGPADSGQGAGETIDLRGGRVSRSSGEDRDATLVRVETFRRGEIRTAIEVSTDIEAEFVVDVFPKVGPAYIREVRVQEGDRVEARQQLAQLDDADFRIAVRPRETVEQMKVALSQEQATYRATQAAFAKATADRQRALDAMAGDFDVLSVKEIADLEAEFEQKKAQSEGAAFAVEKAQAELQLSMLSIDAAQIELESAKNDLDYTTLRSPITGIVQQRNANVGLLVSSSSHLFTVIDPTRLVANLAIPQEELYQVTRTELPVEFTFDALPGQMFAGQVEALNPSVDPASGLIRVRARLPDTAVPIVRPGMFSRAAIVVESRSDAVLVSKRALVYDEGQAYVFSVVDGIAQRHALEIGASTENEVEVVSIDGSPPDPSLQIIVVGQDDLHDGDDVDIAPPRSGNSP